jgi:hypothetical protein
MVDDVTISNGLDWSNDGRLMYYVDTPTQSIDVFDFDVATGAIANRRSLARVPREDGSPDGLTVDADGYLWVALWSGGAVYRYAPDGRLDRVVTHPVLGLLMFVAVMADRTSAISTSPRGDSVTPDERQRTARRRPLPVPPRRAGSAGKQVQRVGVEAVAFQHLDSRSAPSPRCATSPLPWLAANCTRLSARMAPASRRCSTSSPAAWRRIAVT